MTAARIQDRSTPQRQQQTPKLFHRQRIHAACIAPAAPFVQRTLPIDEKKCTCPGRRGLRLPSFLVPLNLALGG